MSVAAALLFFGLWTAGPQNVEFDYSCATFHAYMSEEELIARFGRDNVTRGAITGADDGPFEGTILFANRADARVDIAWRDPESRQKPAWIRIQGENSRWTPPNGVALGAELRAVEKANGWPFRLAGFSSRTHGAIQSWGRGKLGVLSPLCQMTWRFQPQWDGDDHDVIRQVRSGSNFSSGHPAMQQLNPRVVSISIAFPVPDTATNPADALLDALVFGPAPIRTEAFAPPLRVEAEAYQRRAAEHISSRPIPSSPELKMSHAAQVRYETRLAAMSADPAARAAAAAYVDALRPCYEWEGFPDCPEREARFADEYRATHPNAPFRDLLPLLAAHRWLCAAQANTQDPDRARNLFQERLQEALRSTNILIRTAADRLAVRGTCYPPQS